MKRSFKAIIKPNHKEYAYSEDTLVVENVPSEKCNENEVKQFFGQFGEIENININQQLRNVTIKFKAASDAHKAFVFPESIFGNRFVRMQWLRIEKSKNESKKKI